MTKEQIVDGLELYTVGRLKKSQVYITVEELQKYIDEIKALEQNLCEDCISRKQLVRELNAQMAVDAITREVALDMLDHLPSIQPKSKTDVLDKIRAEISKSWHKHPKNRYEEGLKDQALKDMQIIDKYKAESEE